MKWLLIILLHSPAGTHIVKEYSTDYTVLEACKIAGENSVRKLAIPKKAVDLGWSLEYKCLVTGGNGQEIKL